MCSSSIFTFILTLIKFGGFKILQLTPIEIHGLVGVGLIEKSLTTVPIRYCHVGVVNCESWRTLCSVCATGARVARALQLVICRSGGFTGTVTLLFQLVVQLGWYGLV